MSSHSHETTDTGCLALGMIGGFFIGSIWLLWHLPQQMLQKRQQLLGMRQEIALRREMHDPVAESIARGKAQAQRRRTDKTP